LISKTTPRSPCAISIIRLPGLKESSWPWLRIEASKKIVIWPGHLAKEPPHSRRDTKCACFVLENIFAKRSGRFVALRRSYASAPAFSKQCPAAPILNDKQDLPLRPNDRLPSAGLRWRDALSTKSRLLCRIQRDQFRRC